MSDAARIVCPEAPCATGASLLIAAALTGVPTLASSRQISAQGTTVTGFVFDSIARVPLAGAQVQFVLSDSTRAVRSYNAVTDERGAYRLEGLTPGTYLAGFFHPAVDSLGLEPAARQVIIGATPSSRVNLAIPSPETVVATLCPSAPLTDTTALLLGFVRDAASLQARPRATVSVRWSELVVSKQGITRSSPEVTVVARDNGWFALCEVPAGSSALLRATEGADTSGFVETEIPGRRLIRQDLFVGRWTTSSSTVALGGDTSVRHIDPVRGRSVRLAGTVRASTGTPIAGAKILVWGIESEVQTSDSGTFALADLPAGSRMVEVRAIGFVPARGVVHLFADGRTNVASFSLTSLKTYLDTVKVTATRIISGDRSGFERRRRSGMGRYFDAKHIQKQNAIYTSDLLRMTPGVQLRYGDFGHAVLMRAIGGKLCAPDIFIDGLRYARNAADMDLFVRPDEIDGIEIYTQASSTPAQFASFQSGCGSVVIWTRPPAPKVPKHK